jgi:hypothetical protein
MDDAPDFSQFGMEPPDELDRVGSVGRIEDDVTISDEDIKMLKDIASREYQLNMTQLTPQLSATFGDIRETVDFDKFYDGFVRRGIEELQSNYTLQKQR